ncbi:hypothetical protein BSZ40_03960 [Buchananella hordeovulneris]|uniref:Uncharacterized protein n=1 Tax=Buchananella hordeovulneris TaxID=52770 RepID=A0A1Q5PWT2_9ACTO|nr:hypothetical protein BSZ40_03960 [Buchananella hordeovulneris]
MARGKRQTRFRFRFGCGFELGLWFWLRFGFAFRFWFGCGFRFRLRFSFGCGSRFHFQRGRRSRSIFRARLRHSCGRGYGLTLRGTEAGWFWRRGVGFLYLPVVPFALCLR